MKNINASEHNEHAKPDLYLVVLKCGRFINFLVGETRGFKIFYWERGKFSLPSPHYKISSLARFFQRSLFIASHPVFSRPQTISTFFSQLQSVKMDPRANRSCYNCVLFLLSSSSACLFHHTMPAYYSGDRPVWHLLSSWKLALLWYSWFCFTHKPPGTLWSLLVWGFFL